MAGVPTWEGAGAGRCSCSGALVGVGRLHVAHQRGRPEEGGVRIVMFAADRRPAGHRALRPRGLRRPGPCLRDRVRLVRGRPVVLFLIAGRDDAKLRRSVIRLAVSSTLSGSDSWSPPQFVDGGAQYALWIAGGRWSTSAGRRSSVSMAGRLMPAHFAERHGLIIIMALGESIVALGRRGRLDLTARGRTSLRCWGSGSPADVVVDLLRRGYARHRRSGWRWPSPEDLAQLELTA